MAIEQSREQSVSVGKLDSIICVIGEGLLTASSSVASEQSRDNSTIASVECAVVEILTGTRIKVDERVNQSLDIKVLLSLMGALLAEVGLLA